MHPGYRRRLWYGRFDEPILQYSGMSGQRFVLDYGRSVYRLNRYVRQRGYRMLNYENLDVFLTERRNERELF